MSVALDAMQEWKEGGKDDGVIIGTKIHITLE